QGLNPACDASPWLYCAICLRRFSVSTSRSASGFWRSSPEMKSPKKPRIRLVKRFHIALLSLSPIHPVQPILAVCLAALPTLQQIADDLGARRIADLGQVHAHAVVSVFHKWAVRELDGHTGIGRAKAVVQRLLLDRFAGQKRQKC